MPEGQGYVVPRDVIEPEDPRAANVRRWEARVLADKEHWKSQLQNMRDDQRFAKGKTQVKPDDPGSYVVNVTLRHVKSRTSGLYARNPTVLYRRRPRLHGQVWDGRAETLIAARTLMQQMNDLQAAAAVGDGATAAVLAPQMDPEMLGIAQRVVFEAELSQQINWQIDKIGRTLEIVVKHQLQEQNQPFKTRMKQQVRRAVTTGVGYVKIGFERTTKMRPEIERQHRDVTEQLARIRQMSADLADDELDPEEPDVDTLQSMLADLESQPEILVREGLSFSFPRSTAIIPDRQLEYLPTFAGCEYVTEEFMLTRAQIQQVYEVHVDHASKQYERVADDLYRQRTRQLEPGKADESLYRVWQIWSRVDGLVYTICEGHPDFLEEPREPEVYIEQFYPWFPIVLNASDDDEDPFPVSDVRLMKPMQEELNRSREGLREHRFANRPKIATPAGMLSPNDKQKLQRHERNAIIELQSLAPGARVSDILQPMSGAPIDPNLYETNSIFEDVLRTLGQQEANFGGVNGATATENSIAEASRQESQGSDSDDFDDMLSRMFRAAGQILLLNMSAEVAHQIAGDGAVWPDVDREAVAEEIYLETEAGSAGRPNAALELQRLERMAPLYVQTPGLSPYWLARRILRAMDENVDIEDAIAPESPSILAMNGLVQRMTNLGDPGAGQDTSGAPVGDAQNNPVAQGPQGASNAPQPPGRQSIGRPANPAAGALAPPQV